MFRRMFDRMFSQNVLDENGVGQNLADLFAVHEELDTVDEHGSVHRCAYTQTRVRAHTHTRTHARTHDRTHARTIARLKSV